MCDQMKRGLRTAAISLALGMAFVSSLARADDCSDALIAESCACQSPGPSESEQRSASDKSSLGKKESRARKSVKARVARASGPSSGSHENSVAEK